MKKAILKGTVYQYELSDRELGMLHEFVKIVGLSERRSKRVKSGGSFKWHAEKLLEQLRSEAGL